jgi:polyhydroxyalkanoate synthesis regulator phasin
MTKEVLLNQYQLQAEIPLAFVRYFENRTDERVLEVVLVYNGVDRFDTVIEPNGMKTDPNIVVVDYNHRGVSTGAYLRNLRVEENYKIDNGDVLDRALVGEIHIPKDAEMFFHDKEGIKRSNGNLYEAVNKGQIQSVSVEFRPYKGKQITDTKTGITTYREWDLLKLSLLDVVAGQPYSGYKLIRSLIQNNNNNMLENIKQALDNGELTKEEIRALVEEEVTTPTPEVTPEETPKEDTREIEIIAKEQEGEMGNVDHELVKDEEPTPEEADANKDGEVSDEEMRSYLKEVKRAFGDNPAMINEKMAEVERMCGDLKKRIDEMTPVANTEVVTPDETDEEVEAQRIRALNNNLAGIPEKVEPSASVVRQLGTDEADTVDNSNDETAKLIASYRQATGFRL